MASHRRQGPHAVPDLTQKHCTTSRDIAFPKLFSKLIEHIWFEPLPVGTSGMFLGTGVHIGDIWGLGFLAFHRVNHLCNLDCIQVRWSLTKVEIEEPNPANSLNHEPVCSNKTAKKPGLLTRQ